MHTPTCSCSVCWAHNFCDAIAAFPCPALDLPPLALTPDHYKLYDCTAEFMATRKAVERFNSARFSRHTPA